MTSSGRPQRLAGLLGVHLDEVDDAVHQGVGEPLADRALAPGQIGLALRAGALDLLGEGHQRSVASGRRLKMTSSTCSSRSAGMSS